MIRIRWIASAVLTCAIGANGQTVIDDFEDGVIDLTQWIPSEPFASSDVTESDGVARLTNRGTLTAVSQFGPFAATARFRFTGHRYDIFEIDFRSDGDLDGRFGRPKNALIAYIRPTDNPDSVEVALVDESQKVALVRAATPFPILLDQFYTFTVEDDGEQVRILVDGQLVISHSVSADYGDHVHFGNRAELLNTPDLITEMDWVEIEAPAEEFADITANGSDELVLIAQGTPLIIHADLTADPAINGDTWILAFTSLNFPFNVFSYNVASGAWTPWLFTFNGPSAQGAIPRLDQATLIQTDALPGGFYTFYLGYDSIPNRRIDFDGLALDAVSVYVANE